MQERGVRPHLMMPRVTSDCTQKLLLEMHRGTCRGRGLDLDWPSAKKQAPSLLYCVLAPSAPPETHHDHILPGLEACPCHCTTPTRSWRLGLSKRLSHICALPIHVLPPPRLLWEQPQQILSLPACQALCCCITSSDSLECPIRLGSCPWSSPRREPELRAAQKPAPGA